MIVRHVLTKPEAVAIKALHDGRASPDQQKLALQAVVQKIANTHDLDWFVDNERASSFASGRRFVGLEIIKYVEQPLKKLFPEHEENNA